MTGKGKENVGTAVILKKVKEVLKPEKTGICLGFMRGDTGDRVIVKCSDVSNISKLMECLASCKELNVRKPELIKAMLTILGVEVDKCKGDLVQNMLVRNPELTSLVPKCGEWKEIMRVIRFSRMGTNARLRKVFLMVSVNARER